MAGDKVGAINLPVTTYKQFAGIAVVAITVLTFVSCSKTTDAGTEMAKTVKVLEQPTAPPQTATQPAGNDRGTMPAQQVGQALASLKAGNYSDTIVHMEAARSNPNKTPQQMMAIQDAMAAVMRDLYTRAANGDSAAKQAIKQYQEHRNKH